MLDFGYYNMDCIKGMAEFPDNYFNLAVVDPPYGINQGGNTNHTRSVIATSKDYHVFDDKQAPDGKYFSELRRVSKNQIIFGANHFIDKIPIPSSCWIVWDKENGENDFADCELAWTSFNKAVRKFAFRWQGMLQGDMKNKERRIHPTQKPVALYKWILKNYADDGDLILDTHVGSASSLIACEDMGFKYVGFEIDETYYRESKERLETYKAQMTINDLITDWRLP